MHRDNPSLDVGFLDDQALESLTPTLSHGPTAAKALLARRQLRARVKAVLGPGALERYDGYDASADPRITNLFSTASYRYGHSALMRERFIPRLQTADPSTLVDAEGLIDPEAAWAVMMANEKPGGHGERAGAVGLLDMAQVVSCLFNA